MPDIKQLISLQFDSTGCTSNQVYKLGKVNFDAESALEGDNGLRCAYFPLYNSSGLYFVNQELSDIIPEAKPFSIYFKYKIHTNNLIDLAPIITYQKENESYTKPFLCIKDKKYFSIHSNSSLTYSTTDISYTFDDKWHTFYVCFTSEKNMIFMIDGRINRALPYSMKLDFSKNIYIGYHHTVEETFAFGGYLDDINIFDNPIYITNFVPPTNYIGNKDVITNYYMNSMSPVYEQDIQDTIEKVRMHTVDKLNKHQLGWLPRRTNLTWYEEENGYFRNGEYEVIPRNVNYTIVTVMEINQPIASSSKIFMEGNLLTLMEAKMVYPLMVFINGYLIKLSKIYFIKSHDRYTLKFIDRDPRYTDKITSFEIIVLPFSIIYEEDYGERADIEPLYAFTADGKFSTDSANIYYYIDPDKEPNYKHIGIREHIVSSKQFGYNKIDDYDWVPDDHYLRFIYKYGTLELVRFAEDGLGAYIKFDSSHEHSLGEIQYEDPDDKLFHYRHTSTDYNTGDIAFAHGIGKTIPSYMRLRAVKGGHTLNSNTFDDFYRATNEDKEFIIPGDTITVYNGSALLDPKFYEIVGHNLLYVNNIYEAGIKFGRNITIQKIANAKLTYDGYMTSEAITLKTVTVQATMQNQSVFLIPEVMDDDGYEYHKFLLFKGHVLMEDQDRYVIDSQTRTLRFLSSDDFMPKGRNLTFLFLKYNKASAFGTFYPKPVFIYANPDENGIVEFESPNGLYVTKNNCAVFINDTFVSPYRIKFLAANKIQLVSDETFSYTTTSNVVIVFLEIANTLENPVSALENMLVYQIARGNRFILYDLGIPKKYKITIDNFLCFDEEGKYIPDLIGSVFNYNIIKRLKTSTPLSRQVRYMTCLYRTDSLENKANILYFNNEPFIKEYLKGRQEFYEMDKHFDELIADFNFSHSYDLTYGENLANSLDYIMNYDKNKIDEIYENKANITRTEYNISGVNKNFIKDSDDNKYKISIPRDNYYSNTSRTYPIFFKNGKLATDWHENFSEDMNYVNISLPSKISAEDTIESLDFHGMSNFLIPLTSKASSANTKVQNYDIFSHLITGEDFNKHFYARIKIKEYLNFAFNATMTVAPEDEYTLLKTLIAYDAFTCTITPAPDHEFNIYTKIDIQALPEGAVIDLNESIRAYDFSATIDVPDSGEVIIEN